MQNALWAAPVTAAAAAASCANKMATHEIRLPRCTSGDRTDRAQRQRQRQQAAAVGDGNIAKLINIFKYLSHCLPASATATASGWLAFCQLQIQVESVVCLLKNHFTVSCLVVIAPTPPCRLVASAWPGLVWPGHAPL